jgi:CBS domain-containing protein
MDGIVRPERVARNLSSLFDRAAQSRGSIQPIALSQPFERVFERLFVGHFRRHPPVAPDIARNANIGHVQRNFAFLGREFHRQRNSTVSVRHTSEHLVVANLENRMSPRPVLKRLGKRQCELANALSVRHVLYFHRFVGNRAGYATCDSNFEGGVMGNSIKDVMTSNPCSIDADKSVAYAAKMMRDEDVGLAPIVEGDKLIGMLTDRDIAIRVVAEGRDPGQVKVRDVASKQVVTIDPQQDLDEALRIMAKHQVRRLAVVEEDGKLVGVVAQADVAREGDDKQTGKLVEEISE